ncbi:amino acid ABC transporter permease [Kineosporia sp. NBRC 101731]|uniref:amino acid ABC transporter permease n=1 Tax=Kineosporia sp. NBRC 101731 TaxID=3032199 RepID=UPI0024A41934|nr:amino acid ABC transporter permease [Kineosporia sp. NBRC 101731]GLY30409.1 permease [Kineosporia sp. NBRC 101731]
MTDRAQGLPVVPVRHPGQVVAAVVVVALLAWLAVAIGRNQFIQWDAVGERLTASAILGGLGVTVWLTIAAMVLGVVGGVGLAVARLSSNRVLRVLSGGYIWLFRGTPVLVQILVWFNLALFFPRLGFGALSVDTNSVITPFGAALLALALNESAYMAEIVRGGIQAVDQGQTEAAQALGMKRSLALRRIVLPQAMRVIIPPTGNELVTLLKTTSLVAVIGAGDLLTKAQAIGAVDFTRMEMLIVASIWYLALVTIATAGQTVLERRYTRGHAGSPQGPGWGRLVRNLLPGRRMQEVTR